MAVLCALCLHPAAEDEPRCPACGEDLFDQLVPLVEDPSPLAGRPRPKGLVRLSQIVRRQLSAPADVPILMVPVCPSPGAANQTLVLSRVIALSPGATEAALDGWWQAHSARAVVDVGHDHLKLGAPSGRSDGGFRRMPADLHRWWAWPGQHLELELSPWSRSQTELTLRPRRRVHNLARYFSTGQAILDRMVSELMGYPM